jgi:calreticulin
MHLDIFPPYPYALPSQIFNYKDENHLIKKEIRPKDDELTHVYTLIVHPDQTYEVEIDNKNVAKGNLKDDWDFLPAKEVRTGGVFVVVVAS